MPLSARLILAAAVAVLGVAVLYTATGGLGQAVASLGSTLGGFVDDLTATPPPRETPVPVLDAPRIAPPAEPYTNLGTVDLSISVPRDVVGVEDARVRIYLALEGLEPAPLQDVPPPGSTPQLIVPVELTAGSNTFTATVVRPGVESAPSAPVQFILDQAPPPITLIRPTDGATVNATTVELVGTSQPRTTLLARNETNGSSLSATAAADGTYAIVLPLDEGENALSVHATDPAGNVADATLTVVRGTGRLTSRLAVSSPRLRVEDLPIEVELSALVSNPDGQPLPGAGLTFTLSVPGIRTITSEALTGGDGRASFRTAIPEGALPGQGIATVFVTTADFGTTSDRAVVTVVE